MKPGILIAVACLAVSACATTDPAGPPPLGMRFGQPYPSHFGGGTHAGLDIDAPLGSTVRSVADGVVVLSDSLDLRGIPTNVVLIRHEGDIYSRYLHIGNLSVRNGDTVRKGQPIAVLALNGPGGPNTTMLVPYPHLHLEILRGDQRIDPMQLNFGCGDARWRWPLGCAGDAGLGAYK